MAYFQGQFVSFREGNHLLTGMILQVAIIVSQESPQVQALLFLQPYILIFPSCGRTPTHWALGENMVNIWPLAIFFLKGEKEVVHF